MEKEKIKLPKQFKHWVKSSGLSFHDSGRERYQKFNFKGRDRYWRIDCYGKLCCSCPAEHFDRWGNSRGAEYPTMPKTKAEFQLAVKELIELSKDKT